MTRNSTGLPDLDLVLGGGLEPGSMVVIAGEPGTGKTIMAQEICFQNAGLDRKALYYTTLSEPHAKLVRHLGGFRFFDREALGTRLDYIHLGDLLRGEPPEPSAPSGLRAFVDEIVRNTMEVRPSLVVVDSIRMLRDVADDESALRSALYDLTSRVAKSDATLLLLGEYTPDEMQSGPEFAQADGILQLVYEPREPIDRRWMRVIKMRGGAHREGKHTFHITERGIEIFPRIETLQPTGTPAFSGRLSSGTPGLDALMGGGIPAGDATLVTGPSGAGKTIVSLRFIAEGLDRGERCLYVTFQDAADQLLGSARTFGWNLDEPRAAGNLVIEHLSMSMLDLDVLVSVIRRHLEGGRISRVALDSLSELALAAREGERFPAYLRSLTGLIRSAGASLMVASETKTLGPIREPLDGLMFLFQNVVQVRYVERNAAVDRVLNVLKMRNSRHDSDFYRCTIGESGLTIGERLPGDTPIPGGNVLTTS